MSSASAVTSATSGRLPLDRSHFRVPHFGVESLLTNPDLPLPDDPAALQQLVRELLAEVRRLRQENEQLRHRLDQALRLHFGQRSERSRPRRARVPRDPHERDESGSRPGHGRQSLPEHLPRERVEYDLAEADKPCPCCGGPRVCIGEQVSEQLDYRPASFLVVQHVRKTWACRCCDGPSERRFTTAGPAVVGPIPKGLPGPGLLAHLLTCKYADHRVQGEAVYEMGVGLSWPGCRTRPQTAGMLLWSRAMVVSDSGKGATRSRQVGAGKTNASEPLRKCRNSRSMSKPGSGGCPGISAGDACLLPARHPALRRREPGTGSYTEPWNLSPRWQGRSPSGAPRGREYRREAQGRNGS